MLPAPNTRMRGGTGCAFPAATGDLTRAGRPERDRPSVIALASRGKVRDASKIATAVRPSEIGTRIIASCRPTALNASVISVAPAAAIAASA